MSKKFTPSPASQAVLGKPTICREECVCSCDLSWLLCRMLRFEVIADMHEAFRQNDVVLFQGYEQCVFNLNTHSVGLSNDPLQISRARTIQISIKLHHPQGDCI